MKILSVIPARSGSKGLKDKNIRALDGLPLLGYAGIVSNNSKLINKTILSSDSSLYQSVAKKFRIESPFTRPKEISGDMISDIDVLSHALVSAENYYKISFDYVVMLQPTSPFRTSNLIDESINELIKKKFDALWTVSEISKKFHPYKQLEIDNNKICFFNERGSKIIARQQLSKTYIRNGQCYVFSRRAIKKNKSVMTDNTGFLITPNHPNIDDINDFKSAEKYFKIYKKINFL